MVVWRGGRIVLFKVLMLVALCSSSSLMHRVGMSRPRPWKVGVLLAGGRARDSNAGWLPWPCGQVVTGEQHVVAEMLERSYQGETLARLGHGSDVHERRPLSEGVVKASLCLSFVLWVKTTDSWIRRWRR
jgi:hypothetical protein